MGEFTIQISNELVNQLVDDAVVPKKKTRRTGRKVAREPKNPESDLSQKQILDGRGKPEIAAAAGWPVQSSLFLPATLPVQPAHPELENIRSVLRESEKIVERLRTQEENML
ncbi:unnamed protein product [Lupinus luteus]|uniref:Uncharacterized protein n=1 Tax=Lupinus luteus TaxID=3873 RepID=A0AAV1WXD3_LUPLU